MYRDDNGLSFLSTNGLYLGVSTEFDGLSDLEILEPLGCVEVLSMTKDMHFHGVRVARHYLSWLKHFSDSYLVLTIMIIQGDKGSLHQQSPAIERRDANR